MEANPTPVAAPPLRSRYYQPLLFGGTRQTSKVPMWQIPRMVQPMHGFQPISLTDQLAPPTEDDVYADGNAQFDWGHYRPLEASLADLSERALDSNASESERRHAYAAALVDSSPHASAQATLPQATSRCSEQSDRAKARTHTNIC